MFTMKKIHLLGLTVIATLLANPVYANKAKKFKITPPQGFNGAPQIDVYSTNGEKYNKVDSTKVTKVSVGTNLKCQFEGKGNKAYDGNLKVPGFAIVSANEPADFMLPHSKAASRKFRWDTGSGQTLSPQKVCNQELQKKLSQSPNKTKYHILADGFTVKQPAALNVEYTLRCNATGLGKSSYGTKRILVNAKYHCKASALAKNKIPKVKPKVATLIPLVSKVSFKAKKPISIGQCPTYVGFDGSITATRKGQVKYRYINNKGKKSPLFTLNFAKAGTKKTGKWGTTVSKPNTMNQIKVPGGRKSPYEVEGFYRLVVESPKSNKQAKAIYKVDCDKPDPSKRRKSG
jgi:hypothetical protein